MAANFIKIWNGITKYFPYLMLSCKKIGPCGTCCASQGMNPKRCKYIKILKDLKNLPPMLLG